MKSSAVLIALVCAAVLTAILTLSILDSQQNTISVLKSNDRGVAESLARSGIDKGLLHYKTALEEGKLDEVYYTSKTDKADSCSLTIRMDALSYGKDFSASNWLSLAQAASDQGALMLKNSDELNIDLNYFYKFSDQKNKPTNIEIKFSNPFVQVNGELKLATGDSSILAELIDANQDNSVISKSQGNNKSSHQILIERLSNCFSPESSCKLRVKPSLSDKSALLYLKIQAKSASGIIPPSSDKPGTVVIESIGSHGKVKMKLEAKYENLSGKYLGIFYPVIQ